MPITTVSALRTAIENADIPEDMRRLGIDYLANEPERALDDNAIRGFFWFGPLALRQHAAAILAAGHHPEPRTHVVRVRLNQAEYAAAQEAADSAGLTMSAYVRSLLPTA